MRKNVIGGTEYQLFYFFLCNLSHTPLWKDIYWRYVWTGYQYQSQHQYLGSSSHLCISLLTVIIHKKYLGLPAIRWDKLCKHRELELDRLQLPDSFEHQHQKQKSPCQVHQVLRLISLHIVLCCCCAVVIVVVTLEN